MALAGDLCVKNGAKMDVTLELGPCRTSLALTSTEKFLDSFSSSFLFKSNSRRKLKSKNCVLNESFWTLLKGLYALPYRSHANVDFCTAFVPHLGRWLIYKNCKPLRICIRNSLYSTASFLYNIKISLFSLFLFGQSDSET